MDFSDALEKRIKELMKEKGWTPYNLADEGGIKYSRLNDFFRKKVDYPKSDLVVHICEAFNIELWEFYKSPLFENTYAEKNKKLKD